MKKLIAIAAILAATVACTKNEQPVNESKDAAFQKGQKVTLSVSASYNQTNQNDAPATRVSSDWNTSTSAVDFKWEEGDKINVIVGKDTSEFTLTSGAGTASAIFTGEMPAEGSKYTMVYPVEDPGTTQTYTAGEALPHDAMKFSGEGEYSVHPTTVSLKAQNAALKLNLYGLDRKVSKIEVTNLSDSETYTLHIEDPVKIGATKATATPFFVVVPPGNYQFIAKVTLEEVTPAVDIVNTVHYVDNGDQGVGFVASFDTLAPSAAQTFTAGQVLDMPAQLLTLVWAPVNCGTDADHPYGLMYQWGRKDGQGYNDGSTYASETAPTFATVFQGTNGDYTGTYPLSATTFYKYGSGSTFEYDWIKSGSNDYWNKAASPNDAEQEGRIKPIKGNFDPCPDGWRVPTCYELKVFLNKCRYRWATSEGKSGFYLYDPESGTKLTEREVFLPGAGVIKDEEEDEIFRARYRNGNGYYWSSSVSGDYGRYLRIDSDGAEMRNGYRVEGFSVRCVQE